VGEKDIEPFGTELYDVGFLNLFPVKPDINSVGSDLPVNRECSTKRTEPDPIPLPPVPTWYPPEIWAQRDESVVVLVLLEHFDLILVVMVAGHGIEGDSILHSTAGDGGQELAPMGPYPEVAKLDGGVDAEPLGMGGTGAGPLGVAVGVANQKDAAGGDHNLSVR
jgi:hypothetical protein